MAILITPDTRILVQGITGAFGGRHAGLSLDYGTKVVAGVTPGKGGLTFEHGPHRVPIFNSVADAARATGATVSAIFVPPPFAADAILECCGIGGDPVNGTSHLDVIRMFNDDPETRGIVMIGEIGGSTEVDAARWIKAHCRKPVAGFIAGATAPPGRRMGHAGAIVGGAEDTAAAKISVFRECGIEVAETPSDMADALVRAAKARGVALN